MAEKKLTEAELRQKRIQYYLDDLKTKMPSATVADIEAIQKKALEMYENELKVGQKTADELLEEEYKLKEKQREKQERIIQDELVRLRTLGGSDSLDYSKALYTFLRAHPITQKQSCPFYLTPQ